jgi:glycosyltransferase involved in cell wall biosynthesis
MSHTPTMMLARSPNRASDGAERLRALFVVDGLSFNGAVCLAAAVAPRFGRAGAVAELFSLFPVDAERRVPVDPSVRVTRGASGRVRARWTFPQVLFRLLRAARRADVVVAVSEVGPGLLLSSAAARVARRPLAVIVHADLASAVEQWVPRRLRRRTYAVHRRADASICISDALVRPVLAAGIDPSRVRVVPTGIDVSEVRARARETHEVEPNDVPRIVGLGRLSEEKGFDLLVRAHAAVRTEGLVHELALIGEGSERESLRRLANELGVGDSVQLPGFVENPFPTVASAAAFVLPSRREGVPLTLLQALALGVPAIATRCGVGVESALEQGRLGTLVARESVPALTEAIRLHLQGSAEIRERAALAAKAADRFDIGLTAASLVDVLRPLRRNRAGAARVTAAPPSND